MKRVFKVTVANISPALVEAAGSGHSDRWMCPEQVRTRCLRQTHLLLPGPIPGTVTYRQHTVHTVLATDYTLIPPVGFFPACTDISGFAVCDQMIVCTLGLTAYNNRGQIKTNMRVFVEGQTHDT